MQMSFNLDVLERSCDASVSGESCPAEAAGLAAERGLRAYIHHGGNKAALRAHTAETPLPVQGHRPHLLSATSRTFQVWPEFV